MKRTTLLFCAACLGLGMQAQEKKPLVMLGAADYLIEYRVSSISPNGKWACGNVNDGVGHGFVWNLISGELKQLSPSPEFSAALGVSNDGTVAGEFVDTEVLESGVGVETGGYWKGGKWHHLPVEGAGVSENAQSGAAWCISPNGKYVGGIAYQGAKYLPVVWEIGGEMTLYVNRQGAVYSVSDDASIVAGWTYHPVKSNRTPTIWTTSENNDSTLINYEVYSPWGIANHISPDMSKVLAYDRIYDVKTGISTMIDTATFEGGGKCVGFEFHQVTNSGNVVGYFHHSNMTQYAAYYKDGKLLDLKTWLLEQGADVEHYHLYQCSGISEDEKTFVINVVDSLDVPRIMVVRLDVNVETPEPVALKTEQLEGTDVCRLTWNKPLVNSEAVKGYHVWRNGEKITAEPVDTLFYYDSKLETGKEYEYAITAVYENAESEKSESSTVAVVERAVSAPRGLSVYPTGLKDVRLIWDTPVSNLPGLDYFSEVDQVYSFGGGEYNHEFAVRFSKEDLAHYADKKITEVSFYPMSIQNSWTVSFYTLDSMTPFYQEELSTENFIYGVQNSVRLKNPVTVPADKDIIVGITVDVTNYGGYETSGIIFNSCKPGYSDLLRRVGEANFTSLREEGLLSEEGPVENSVTFPLGIHFGDNAVAEEKITYKVYANEELVGETSENILRLKELADGFYEFRVEAVYEGGDVSAPITATLTMKANTAVYKKITELDATVSAEGELTLKWSAPVLDDETIISYANDTNTGGIAATENLGYSYQIGTKYDAAKLRGYNDGSYYITDVRFYPLADADFTFFIKVGDEVVAEKALERGVDYTIGTWNTVKLDEPVKVEPATEYFMVLDCYDVTPEAAPVGMDSEIAFPNVSDLVSTDDGDTFTSLYVSSQTTTGNWMVGLVVRAGETEPLPIEGYHVDVNRNPVTTELLTTTEYQYKLPKEGPYSVRVNVVYTIDGKSTKVDGGMKFVEFVSGIEELENAIFNITLDEAATSLKANMEGVTRMALYAVSGQKVASAEGNTVEISHLTAGVYVLDMLVNGKAVQTKICVRR